MKARWEMVGALVLAFAAAPVLAIDLGDPAPPLKIKEWVKGKPVDLKEAKGKNIVVVEFWATWCGPCKQTIPLLTELQKKFKDQGVVFIGISDETTDKVKPFVEKMGKNMDYIVALDDDQATNKAYMKAFKINGIPHAFIVDKAGALVWSDDPRAGLEQALEEIIADKYDIEAAKKMAKLPKMLQEYLEMVTEGGKSAKKKAPQLGEKIVELGGKNPGLMNEMAWEILTREGIEHRDLELAMMAAKAALDASKGKDPAILDTYALALWETGKKAEAAEYQKKAIAACDVPEMKKDLEDTLKKYEKEAGDKKDAKKGGKKKAEEADEEDENDEEDDEGEEAENEDDDD